MVWHWLKTTSRHAILKTMEDNMVNVAPELKEAFTKYIEIQGNREAERELSKTIKELAAQSDIADVKHWQILIWSSKSIWIVRRRRLGLRYRIRRTRSRAGKRCQRQCPRSGY